jgi:D-tagatose-1,6-bisphosphate aldolase subunit GatZ/KbaZ
MSADSTFYLDEIVKAQKRAEPRGITSICSAHPLVLEAVFQHAQKHQTIVLIESTCNQVNQSGGYTGMTPFDFMAYIGSLADRLGFPPERLILGGDHLGPSVWQHEPAESAMAKSFQLIRDYVAAGYSKIHLDASMKLGDDPAGRLKTETSARRAAEMAKVAEQAFMESGNDIAPRYVIGTEVPIPGGAQQVDEQLQVSDLQDVSQTIETTRRAFYDLGLHAAWERVIALVVQPGVEYGVDFVIDYQRHLAQALSKFIEDQPLVYEAHSTDYQLPTALRQMVEDHFAILKVGPALTFAFRETLFALAMIESERFPKPERSNLIKILDHAMLDQPGYWAKYYPGDANAQAVARKYSFSDRSRYYWPDNAVQAALNKLFANFDDKAIPLTLLSQYLPVQFKKIRAGLIRNNTFAIIQDKLFTLLDIYEAAVNPRISGH